VIENDEHRDRLEVFVLGIDVGRDVGQQAGVSDPS
jgi:hypothetical protein